MSQNHNFKTNREFFAEAPVGTAATLVHGSNLKSGKHLKPNHNNTVYKHEGGNWNFHTSSGAVGAKLAEDWDWDEPHWYLIEIKYPDGKIPGGGYQTREQRDAAQGFETVRTPQQNAHIVANIQKIMDVFAATVKEGKVPDSSDVFWMDKIVTAVENGEQLKGMGYRI